jgi:hypothetical protein
MSISYGDIHQIPRTARRAEQSGWFQKAARAGYAAKGMLYMVIGVLATKAAFGQGGATTDQKGAMREIAASSFGSVLLALVGVGLAAYALYRFIEAFARKESGAKGIGKMLLRCVSGVLHAVLSVAAFKTIAGDSGSGGPGFTARLMEQPFGQFLVGAVGALIIGFAIYLLRKAWKADLEKELDTARMSEKVHRLAIPLGRAGFAARGVVFSIIGVFFLHAAATYDPSKADGIDGALRALQQSDLGPIALAVVAIGLVCFAAFCFVRARYFRVA